MNFCGNTWQNRNRRKGNKWWLLGTIVQKMKTCERSKYSKPCGAGETSLTCFTGAAHQREVSFNTGASAGLGAQRNSGVFMSNRNWIDWKEVRSGCVISKGFPNLKQHQVLVKFRLCHVHWWQNGKETNIILWDQGSWKALDVDKVGKVP